MVHSYSIQGSRLSLLPLERENIQLIRCWRNLDDVRTCFINQEIISAEQQEKWYSSYLSKPMDYVFQVMNNETNSVIGMCSLYNFTENNTAAEFGRLIIDPRVRGKGYGTEALKLTIELAFAQMKLSKIFLEVFSDNSAALKTYQNCGMKKIGVRTLNGACLAQMAITGEEYI